MSSQLNLSRRRYSWLAELVDRLARVIYDGPDVDYSETEGRTR